MKPFSELPEENMFAIYGKINNKLYSFFDPITILMIIGIAVNVIKIIYECRRKSKVMKFLLRKNSLASRIFIKENIYDKLIEQGMSSEKAELACEKLKEFYAEEDWEQHLKPLYE